MHYFDSPRSSADHADIRECLRRGTGTILAENEHALLLQESDWLTILCADSFAAAKELLPLRKEDTELIVHGDALGKRVAEELSLSTEMRYYQFLYEKAEAPVISGPLTIRHPEESDWPIVSETYRTVPEDVLRRDFERDDFLAGYIDDRLAAFIGVHSEGVMGILNVLPAYRRRGCAAQLYAALIALQLQRGRIPYAQVECGNLASLALQDKLSLTRSKQVFHWLSPAL